MTPEEHFHLKENGSGGYLEFTLTLAAKKLYGLDIDISTGKGVSIQHVRHCDFIEYIVKDQEKEVLRFASAYGFRHIQNIVRKMKTKQIKYQMIEIMACPSGCVNGGGQLKASDPLMNKVLVDQVLQVYQSNNSLDSLSLYDISHIILK